MPGSQTHKQRLVLIDGYAILHRAYHAFPPTLRTRKGELVNAVYGFTRMLLKVIEDLTPECIAVAFDLPQPTFRHKEFIGYQVQRPQMDEELKGQIERVKEVVKTLNIPIFSCSGFEADDVIGTLTNQANKKADMEVVIVTGDRDIMQLVNSKTKIYFPTRGFAEAKLFGIKDVEALLGVRPDQIVHYKALMGDNSDNYPGVPGIGPKTAVLLLREYGSLDNVYKHLGKIKPAVAEKLKKGKGSASLSQKLATIVKNAPVKLKLKACAVHDYDREKAIKLFQELEFRSLIYKLPGVEVEVKKEEQQIKLF